MTLIELAGVIIGSILSLGGLIAGAGYGYGQFYKGRNAKTIEDFSLFNTQLDSLTKVCNEQAAQITALQADIKRLTQEIGRLQGINEEKDKKIKELTDMLANRDPALAEYMEFSREAILELKGSVQRIKERLDTIDSKLNQTTERRKTVNHQTNA